MDFGTALQATVSHGARISREAWSARGLWVVRQPGYPDGVPLNATTAQATGMEEGTVCRVAPYLMMKAVDVALVPWLPSQSDLFAADWTVTVQVTGSFDEAESAELVAQSEAVAKGWGGARG